MPESRYVLVRKKGGGLFLGMRDSEEPSLVSVLEGINAFPSGDYVRMVDVDSWLDPLLVPTAPA